ncbi:hypothetical protein N658DRAFT_248739 [Parathielavia hyrcaniae]|uniref:Uncharacterized protein n=1 Tax=Parathielavia hyrcaniae TaxID=113614 RepID=A0AAN6T3Z4_9PEZI|nr:hypothetical protein N658DRAFT_248739 [Parathielavia hyrcaniae]
MGAGRMHITLAYMEWMGASVVCGVLLVRLSLSFVLFCELISLGWEGQAWLHGALCWRSSNYCSCRGLWV